MKHMKKILIGVGVAFGLLLIILIGVSIYASSLVNEDFLVEQLESNMNCRAEISDLSVGLFSSTSGITLKGVKLGPRAAVANKGTPLSERKPMQSSLISAESIDLALQLGALIDKKLVVEKFVINGAQLDLRLLANGKTNLNPLFTTPRIVKGERNPALDKKPEPTAEAEPAESSGPFTAGDLPISGNIDRIGFTNSKASIRLANGETINISDLDFLLTDIDIDGQDLAGHNSANARIDANVLVSNAKKQEKVKLILTSNGRIVPFDKGNGRVNPNLVYELVVHEGSTLHSAALMDALAGSIPMLDKIGLKMKKLKEKAVLLHNVPVKISYHTSQIKFLNEPTFKTKHYDLGIRKNSWIRLANSTHQITGKVISSREESDKAIQGVDAKIQKAVKGDAAQAKTIRDKLLGSLVENDRVYLAFTSSGSLGNPNVKLLSNIPDLTDLLKGAASEYVKNRLDNELKKVPGGKAAKDVLKNLF